MAERLLLLEHRNVDGIDQIDTYEMRGGYEGLRRAVGMDRQAVIDEVKASGLRGRGGAGFPAWIKWNSIPKDRSRPHYVICNADEGEPGTFKDRELMVRLPHMVVEGIAIAAYATQAERAYIYIRGEFVEAALSIRRAVDEAYERGYIGRAVLGRADFCFDLFVHMGAGSYECGEESALMSSLMGERGQPRLKFPHAPLPVIEGLWGAPTLINNVETYACVPHILRNGGAWYATMGTKGSTGTKIMSVSGHVARPGNYEVEMGTPLLDLLDLAGGVTGGALKAVIPGGSSVPILPADRCAGVNLDFESCQAAGTMLGSGGCMVFHDRTDIVALMRRTAQFYAHESCGKCAPCREGTRWILQVLDRITAGGGRNSDIDLLSSICDQIDGRSYCALGDAAAWPIRASIKHYRHEYEHWIAHGRSPVGDAFVPPVPRRNPRAHTLSRA
ncbi:MAG TPA: NADH-quinone oxidoreductase subunit NuoF [Chthonomonadales bacterium]|nr:NADH-quinone oxidoreductase subunit NuoF [Chthonomonadales bacterium]